MAFSSISWSSVDDLMTQMSTFLTGNGWTQDQLDTTLNRAAFSQGTVFVQFDWDEINRLRCHQSLGFIGTGTLPGFHTDDSGPANVGERFVLFGNGPGSADFFSGSVGSSFYFHAAIEYAPNLFTYLSFGKVIKVGTWTGGEYLATQAWGIDSAVNDDPFDVRHYVLFDARHTGNGFRTASIHSEGWPGQAVNEKWGAIGGNLSGTSTDRAGESREKWLGGMREGMIYNALNYVDFQPNSGFVPLQTIELYRREGGPFRLAAFVPDMRGLKITNLDVLEEILVGSDTWRIYPWTRKADIGSQKESNNEGLAIKKVP